MDFEKIFAVNKFFENKQTTEVQKDINELKHSFSALDSSFDTLLINYLLIPLTESENDKKSIRDSYESFLEDFKRTTNLLIGFYNKYKTSNDFKDLGLSVSIENKFINAKKSYDLITTKANKLTNPNFEKLVKHLNDAYFAYVYLLCGFNSIINAYNKNYPKASIKQIENVPEPPDLGVFTDTNVSDYVKNFVNFLSTLNVD
ncbi:MAG: hypothetical protein IJX32_01265 [Spirochaetaceae bacterium]|nr:hypothetical protein [Spirochaetaceae bacterium]